MSCTTAHFLTTLAATKGRVRTSTTNPLFVAYVSQSPAPEPMGYIEGNWDDIKAFMDALHGPDLPDPYGAFHLFDDEGSVFVPRGRAA